jgi:hypothetical protein
MKKNLFLLGSLVAVGALFTSCNDDDNNDNNNNGEEHAVELYTSSNTTGKISVTDLEDANNTVTSFTTTGTGTITTDAEGIYFYPGANQIIQASRTNNRLEAFGNVQLAIQNGDASLLRAGNSAAGELNGPREIAVSGNNVFVVQSASPANGMANKILVYSYDPSAATFTLTKTFDIAFNLWGIHYDGDDLFAVIDESNEIAEFTAILTRASGPLNPAKRVKIESLQRTHGITYSKEDDVLVLTDIGLAANDTDGGVVVIENFSTIFDGTSTNGEIPITKQKRIYGVNSTMGNPVDVAYDHETGKIYVAERLNAGGRVLTFNYPTAASADVAPANARAEAGVSAVYLSRR